MTLGRCPLRIFCSQYTSPRAWNALRWGKDADTHVRPFVRVSQGSPRGKKIVFWMYICIHIKQSLSQKPPKTTPFPFSLCIYVYKYMCKHIHIYIYIHMYKHVYMQEGDTMEFMETVSTMKIGTIISGRDYLYVNIHTYICMCIYIYMDFYIYIYIHLHIYLSIYLSISTSIYLSIYLSICIYIYIYI